MAARTLWKQGKAPQALQAYALALKERPTNIRALLEMARALAGDFQNNQAESLTARAEELCGDNFVLLSAVAETYQIIHRPLLARQALERLQNLNGLKGPQWLRLASLFEFEGNLESALQAANACAAETPERSEPLLLKGRLLRVLGKPTEARPLLRQVTQLSDPQQAVLTLRAHYELALIADGERSYREALEHLTYAKTLQRALPGYHAKRNLAQQLNKQLLQVYLELSRAQIAQWKADASALLDASPLGFLLGFPRSGTTLLEQGLAAHPEVLSLSESPLFTHCVLPGLRDQRQSALFSVASLENLNAEVRQGLQSSYLHRVSEFLGCPLQNHFLLDKNPNHTSLWAAMLRVFPHAKILLARRDPRDVLLSCYFQFFAQTEFSVQFLDMKDAAQAYLNDARIGTRLEELAPESVLCTRYEDFVDKSSQELRSTLDFLQLPWSAEVHQYREKMVGKPLNSPSHAEVRRPLYGSSIGRWRNYPSLFEPLLAELEPLCRAWGYD